MYAIFFSFSIHSKKELPQATLNKVLVPIRGKPPQLCPLPEVFYDDSHMEVCFIFLPCVVYIYELNYLSLIL